MTEPPSGSRSATPDEARLILAVMSQEVRTLLNAVVGYTELLQAEIPGPLTEEQREQLARIHDLSDRLLELMGELVAYSGLNEEEDEPAESAGSPLPEAESPDADAPPS